MKLAFVIWLYLNNTLSVQSYGALGNGSTDDTNAINSCFTAAASQGKSVYFPLPSVTYLCNTDVAGNILTFTVSGLKNITIYGDPGTTITTSDTNNVSSGGSTLLYIYSASKDTNLIISNISFVSTHPITQKQTTAVFAQGTNGQNLVNFAIYNSKFTGFGTPVGLQGINHPVLNSDSFYYPNGHNCGQHLLQNPCNSITGYDNGNGLDSNLHVERCDFNGYTGSLPLNCPRPVDGFVYGTFYGDTIVACTCKNFSQECIDIAPQTTNPNTTCVNYIWYNAIDCTLPPGCVEDNGAPHKYNYGIRVDASNAYVINNFINNYVNGILTYEVTFTTLTPSNFNYLNNVFVRPNATDTTYSVQQAISVVGYSGHPITGVNISGNKTSNTDTVTISTTNCTAPVIASSNRYSHVVIP
jgi:hypothetical protein